MPPNDGSIGNMGSLLNISQTLQTIAQNIIKAVTELQQLVPMFTSGQLSANTLVQTGFVRMTGYTVVATGASPGAFYDAATIAAAGSGNEILEVSGSKGYNSVQVLFANGLVYKPGAGEKVAIFYVRS